MRIYKRIMSAFLAAAVLITSGYQYHSFAEENTCLILQTGETHELQCEGDFCSLDTSIAKVSTKGLVTGGNIGSTYIAYGNEDGLHKIPVIVNAQNSGIYGEDCNGCTIDLSTENYQLRVFGTEAITFSTVTPEIISCTSSGTVTSLSTGVGLIHVASEAGNFSRDISVTVVKNKLDYKLTEYTVISVTSAGAAISPSLYDDNVSITYLSGNTDIATVSSTGWVTPVSAGLTTITVAAKDGTGYTGFTDTIFVHCVKEEYALSTETLYLEEGNTHHLDIAAATITSSSKNISVTNNIITALKAGSGEITVSLPETAVYKGCSKKIKVIVTAPQKYKLSLQNAEFSSTVQYCKSATLQLTTECDTAIDIPLSISCGEESIYNDVFHVAKGINTYTINVEEIPVIGTNEFTVTLGSESIKFTARVLAPDFQITIDDIPQYIQSGDFIQVSYTVRNNDSQQELHAPIQLMLDGQILATEQVNLSGDINYRKSVLSTYIPTSLADGQHILRLCIILNESTDAVYDDTIINISNANMSLLLNNQYVSTIDTYVYSSALSSTTIKFATASVYEQIKTISFNNKIYSVQQNATTLDLTLAKNEEQIINVVVLSADGKQERSYAITIIRADDNTNITGEFEDGNGNIFYVNTDTLPYRLCLPSETLSGTLTVKVEDLSAKILSINDKAINKVTGSYSINLQDSTTDEIEVKVQADDVNVQIPYTIIISNINYTPEVQVLNSNEIANRVYGSAGVLVGKELVEYGVDSTSVEAAISTGRTKGIVIDLAVSDYNYNQYLEGFITIDEVNYPIHWNSFEGPARELAANIKHGYIYIDNRSLLHDSNITTYTITVKDFADAFTTTNISETTTTVTFGVNVLADDFSMYYDDSEHEIIIETTATNSALSFRKSKDNGLTWTNYQGCGSKISVEDKGTVMYEVTLADSMHNTTTKTITVAGIKDEITLDNVNVYISTSRHADCIYINTLKSNSTTLTVDFLDVFK